MKAIPPLATLFLLIVPLSCFPQAFQVAPTSIDFGKWQTKIPFPAIESAYITVQATDASGCLRMFSEVDLGNVFSVLDVNGKSVAPGSRLDLTIDSRFPAVIRLAFQPSSYASYSGEVSLELYSGDCEKKIETVKIAVKGHAACDDISYNCEPELSFCNVDENAEHRLVSEIPNFEQLVSPALETHYRKHYPYTDQDYEIGIEDFLQLSGVAQLVEYDATQCIEDIKVTRMPGYERKAEFTWGAGPMSLPPKPNLPPGLPEVSVQMPNVLKGHLVSSAGYSEFLFLAGHAPRVVVVQNGQTLFSSELLCVGSTYDRASIKQNWKGTAAAPNIILKAQ